MKSSKIENIVLFLISISFFIGLWHAFPMLNVVNDEMYYVGGVLRAMESHTILPFKNDVPYGTLTYLGNYLLSIVTILLILPFKGFSISSLKIYLIQSPSVMYLSLRILNAIFSFLILYFVNKLLKKEFQDYKQRIFLLVLLFSNIITTTILHTGKMWVLSTLLVIVSFYYLVQSLQTETLDRKTLKRGIFLSIFFSFLALSNFPLNIYSLVCLPIFLYSFRNDREIIRKIILYTVIGFLTYLLITLFNFEGIRNQIISIFSEYHPVIEGSSKNLNFIRSAWIYLVKLLLLFPLILLVILLSIKNKVKNRKLFAASGVYFLTYFSIIAFVANWTSDLSSSLRYLFPLGFFLIFIAASLNIKLSRFSYGIGAVSVFMGILTIYYLSMPTTYNNAYDWINNELSLSDVVIVNEVPELQLIKNKESSLNTKDMYCASKCKNIISENLNPEFKPFVIDLTSKDIDLNKIKKEKYYISDKNLTNSKLTLVVSFTNPGELYHSVDYNLGNYFDLSYLKAKNFGKNIYIYK